MTDDFVWADDYAEDADDSSPILEYGITASPNDFNLLTWTSFIDSGSVVIPGFQRHYVWELPRASRLIESLILGLPIPQVFLYEKGKNEFLVIDGQQRLLTIYFFFKEKFPRKERRTDIRKIFEQRGHIPNSFFDDEELFTPFRLSLRSAANLQASSFHGITYSTLGDNKSSFDLRTLRSVVIKQTAPSDDDSSIYELFSRLNSGGMNLKPQEIRLSLYHSSFYTLLQQLNELAGWRRILNQADADLHQKDVEILLRSFAILIEAQSYSPSMTRFLNLFSKQARGFDENHLEYLRALFESFVELAEDLPEKTFINPKNNRFNVALFEAVFVKSCAVAFREKRVLKGTLEVQKIAALTTDAEFVEAASKATTSSSSVRKRLARADALLSSH